MKMSDSREFYRRPSSQQQRRSVSWRCESRNDICASYRPPRSRLAWRASDDAMMKTYRHRAFRTGNPWWTRKLVNADACADDERKTHRSRNPGPRSPSRCSLSSSWPARLDVASRTARGASGPARRSWPRNVASSRIDEAFVAPWYLKDSFLQSVSRLLQISITRCTLRLLPVTRCVFDLMHQVHISIIGPFLNHHYSPVCLCFGTNWTGGGSMDCCSRYDSSRNSPNDTFFGGGGVGSLERLGTLGVTSASSFECDSSTYSWWWWSFSVTMRARRLASPDTLMPSPLGCFRAEGKATPALDVVEGARSLSDTTSVFEKDVFFLQCGFYVRCDVLRLTVANRAVEISLSVSQLRLKIVLPNFRLFF